MNYIRVIDQQPAWFERKKPNDVVDLCSWSINVVIRLPGCLIGKLIFVFNQKPIQNSTGKVFWAGGKTIKRSKFGGQRRRRR